MSKTSDLRCLVHFPNGLEEIRDTKGPYPALGSIWTIAGKKGLWRVVNHTAAGYTNRWIAGTRVDLRITVVRLSKEQNARPTGSIL